MEVRITAVTAILTEVIMTLIARILHLIQTQGNTELKQYLLDFKTGNILEYDVKSIELLLMADPELHDEFAALNNKKQKQMKFLYLRKFNERNPLYFPKNTQ